MLGRRDLFKLSMGAALARGAGKPRFFTDQEFALVDELTEIIIPADEKSGGAKAAGVAAYIDQRLAEAFEESERDEWRKQLALVAKFRTSDERIRYVSKQPFFKTLKEATVHAYYSSSIGIHDEMDYQGNTLQVGEYSGHLPPRIEFPTVARERLAVAAYPFRKTVKLLDLPKTVADKFDVHAIEPWDGVFLSTDAAYIEQLREALKASNSRVANIAIDKLGGSFYDTDQAVRAKVVEAAKKWIDIAVVLGSPSVRLHVAKAKTPPSATLAAESLKQLAAYGETKNVVIHLENDDGQSEEAFFLVDVLNATKSPWVRALPDFCNSMMLGRGDDYNYKAVTALFNHAYGICHVKDSEQDGKKMFHVDLARTFAIAKAARYRGYFSIEYDAEGDPFDATSKLIEQTLQVLA